VTLITQGHLEARLNKEYSYNFTPVSDFMAFYRSMFDCINIQIFIALLKLIIVSLNFVKNMIIQIFILIVVSLFTS
jgi:hypothetical protein